MRCNVHLEKGANGICNLCGESFCADCLTEVSGEQYCKGCCAIKSGAPRMPQHSPSLAGILSFLVPGLGQLYNGQAGKGILVFATCWLVFPWVIGIIDAARTARKIQREEKIPARRIGCMIAFTVAVVLVTLVFAVLMLSLFALIVAKSKA